MVGPAFDVESATTVNFGTAFVIFHTSEAIVLDEGKIRL